MLKLKSKDRTIKVFALIFGAIFTLVLIFLFNKTLCKEPPKPKTDYYTTTKKTYDPSGNLIFVADNAQNPTSPEYDIENERQKYISSADAQKLGYYPTNADFSAENSILAKITPKSEFENIFSSQKTKKPVLQKTESKKGGYTYSLSEKEVDRPLLVPYYGYIIYTDAKSRRLLDSSLEVLVSDFSGYEPAYKQELAGNPLFIKDGEYYFYYDGKEYNGVVYDKIDENTFSSLTETPVPNSYEYFTYNHDLLLNMLASADTSDRALENIVLSLPDSAGMVQYYPENSTDTDRSIFSVTNNTDIFSEYLIPFCHHSYEKEQINTDNTSEKPQYELSGDTYAWGYLDKDGNMAIEPQYKMSYPFCYSGYAVVQDDSERICFIDTNGKTIYDPYRTLVDYPGLSSNYIHDGFYPREVYSTDNTGMFYFDYGYTLVRRKIVDSANGYKVQRETNDLVTADASTFNYPLDYNLVAYSDGLLLLEKNSLYGYMDLSGKWLVKPTLEYARPFSEGLAVIGYTSDKLGVIDTKGNTVLAFCYSHIEDASGGLLCAYSSELGWRVYSKMSTTKQKGQPTDPRIAIITRQIAQAKAENHEMELSSAKGN